MKQEPEYVAKTLKWCNERRKEQGKRPLKRMPKGKKKDPRSCPCGKAADVMVFDEDWRAMRQFIEKPLPLSVQQFVKAFDRGALPQYVA